MIDPKIWQSEDFAKLSQLAKLLFIGMISMADDHGKGRAKPIYLKSIIFPYEEALRLVDIEKALSEIGTKMSITLYSSDDNNYYRLDNWEKWQRVDKPQESTIPNPIIDISDQFWNDSRIIPESFSPKGKERNTNTLVDDSRQRNVFGDDSPEMKLALLLAKLMRENNPNCKIPEDLQKWCDCFRLVMKIDGREYLDVEDMIYFAQRDEFWKQNILSPQKLRKQYDQLTLKRESKAKREAQ